MQLTLDQARKPDGRHGGWRPGAGRPKKPGAISHDARPDEPARFPQHVTLRIAEGVPSLAREGVLKLIRAAIRESHKPTAADGALRGAVRELREPAVPGGLGAAVRDSHEPPAAGAEAGGAHSRRQQLFGERGAFRIVEFNVLGNHLHLVVEAGSKAALASGIAGFEVRVARRVNALLGRRGKLFPERYHARALKTPREVRNALVYVLLNRKHHAVAQRFTRTWIDPSSSAAWFGGWASPVRADEPWKRALLALPRPTAPPATWLLASGWKRHGLLRFDERPA
ncbi:MAG TPA: hypothetical protein VLT45_28250 [Kofleriaceae bacterium]|nr:hypothetical protein [Kofleriaceae bacterium]